MTTKKFLKLTFKDDNMFEAEQTNSYCYNEIYNDEGDGVTIKVRIE